MSDAQGQLETQDSASLTLAAEAGRLVLQSGGETYRSEETVVELCHAWGLSEVECFATPTGLIASARRSDGRSESVVRRIGHREVDLRRVAMIADAVKGVVGGGKSPASFGSELQRIRETKPRPFLMLLGASGACAAFFSLVFGGSWRDAVAAFFVGMAVKLASASASKQHLPDFIANIAGGLVAGSLASVASLLGVGVNMDKTIIGAIMLLVPGLATVNAIRDTIAGDLVAGVARLADALMSAAAISFGTGFALWATFALSRLLG